MAIDDWVAAALADDTVLVELLIRLKQSSSPSAKPNLPPLEWGHRQRRSKPAVTASKELEPTRCSPTTPLSWSRDAAAASGSDGYESSRPSDRSSGGRSKGTFANESPTATTNKRSRKKKTFAELKEEESLLLKERINLKRDLASLRITLKEQSEKSEKLKRIKLDLHLRTANKTTATSDEPVAAISTQMESSSTIDKNGDVSPSDSCKVEDDVENCIRCFILPDLNMAPSEEETVPETPYGIIS